MAKPVTSPGSARATEPRAPGAVLELRLGARLGSGAGERERERALEAADVGGGRPRPQRARETQGQAHERQHPGSQDQGEAPTRG